MNLRPPFLIDGQRHSNNAISLLRTLGHSHSMVRKPRVQAHGWKRSCERRRKRRRGIYRGCGLRRCTGGRALAYAIVWAVVEKASRLWMRKANRGEAVTL